MMTKKRPLLLVPSPAELRAARDRLASVVRNPVVQYELRTVGLVSLIVGLGGIAWWVLSLAELVR